MKRNSWIQAGTFIVTTVFIHAGLLYGGMDLNGSLDISSYSHYIGGTTGQALFDHSVIQGSIKIQTEAPGDYGIYSKLWCSYSPKGGFDDDFGDEVNYAAGFWKIFRGLTFDLSYWYYDLIEINKSKGDLHAIYLAVDFPDCYKITPYVCIEKDLPTDKDILDGGLLYKTGARYCLPADILGKSIDLNLFAGGHDGAFGKDPETLSYGRIEISTTFKTLRVTLTPVVKLQKGFGDEPKKDGMAEDKFWAGIILSRPFKIR